MRGTARRISMTLGLILSGVMLLAQNGTGCVPFLAESTLAAVDFCFIFDCQNGILGGTISPCSITFDPLTGGIIRGPLFADCP